MKNWIVRTFGLRGSWTWACRQMDKGCCVRPACATGSVKYKIDHEHQRRIVWSFEHNPKSWSDWETANIFLGDFDSIDWIVCWSIYVSGIANTFGYNLETLDKCWERFKKILHLNGIEL